MRIDVVTIFPEYLEPMRHALLGKAIEQNILQVGVHNLRNWATGVHQAVDDSPYGGGPGMVMTPTVWGNALDDVASRNCGETAGRDASLATDLTSAVPHKFKPKAPTVVEPASTASDFGDRAATDEKPVLIVPTPAGVPFTQAMAQDFAKAQHLVFACGRYEGIDQRVIDYAAEKYDVHEVSIGDYVLIGGEVAVLVMAEAIVRLIPGVLGNAQSHMEDSFSDGLLEGPCYTKPRVWRDREVPAVLFSGNHGKVARWRRDQSLLRTQQRRPELLEAVELSAEDRALLAGKRDPES